MKKWETTFNNNHLRLMRVHIGFVVFYTVLSVITIFATLHSTHVTAMLWLITLLVSLVPVLLHVFLAIGAKNKIEISRKVSEIVFAFLLLAFPIGTILSMLYFLPKTTWKMPDDNASV